MIIPFVGETPTGGERTEFLPRSSKDFSKPFLNTHLNTIKIIQNPGYQKRRGQGGGSVLVYSTPSWSPRRRERKQLSVDHRPVNLYSVPQPCPRTKDSYSDGSKPREICSRRSHKARSRVEPDHRRLHLTPSHQRSQTSTDRQASSKMSLPDGAGREEGGPSHRRGHKGSSLLRFSVNFTNLSQHRSCYT